MKKALLIITIILILIGIPVTVFLVKQQQDLRQQAAQNTILYFEPSQVTKKPGDEFTLNLMVNTHENLVQSAEIYLNFDPQYLEMLTLENGSFFPAVLDDPVISNDNGTATITVWNEMTNQPKGGVGVLLTVTVKALADTQEPTLISISNNSIIPEVKEEIEPNNMIVGAEPATINIKSIDEPAQASTTPAASAIPSPTATASITTITSPTNNSTLTSKRPTITGTTFANALVNISINNTTPALTSTFNSSTTGNWSYVPSTDLSLGSHTVVVSAQNPANEQDTQTAAVTFSVVEGTGGTDLASPTPTPNSTPAATPVASPQATPNPTATPIVPAATPTASDDIPTTGTSTPTYFIIALAMMLITLGLAPILIRK